MRYTKEFQRIVQWMFMHKSPSAHDPWKEQDSVFLKRYSNRFICLQLSTISLKQVIRTCMRRSAHLWSDSNFLGWGCETGGCTLPETGGCTLPVAEDAMWDCNFRSLSKISSNHLILTPCQKAPVLVSFTPPGYISFKFLVVRKDCSRDVSASVLQHHVLFELVWLHFCNSRAKI